MQTTFAWGPQQARPRPGYRKLSVGFTRDLFSAGALVSKYGKPRANARCVLRREPVLVHGVFPRKAGASRIEAVKNR